MSDAASTVEDGSDVSRELAGVRQDIAWLRERVDDLDGATDDHDDAIETLTDRVVELELQLSELQDGADADLSRDQKVGKIRAYAFEKATNTGGSARLEYGDTKVDVFDGYEPSDGHAYELTKQAAEGYDGEGVVWEERSEGNNRLVCDASTIRREGASFSRKKSTGGDSQS